MFIYLKVCFGDGIQRSGLGVVGIFAKRLPELELNL